MNNDFILSLALLAALLVGPLAAWGEANPDFDDDAKPILKMQPGLLHYVESSFEVKDTGTAMHPGDDDRRPAPPFIFRARPAGSEGPYNLRLLIQPGPTGHILNVVDMNKVHLNGPGAPPPQIANRAPMSPPPAYAAPTPSTPAPSAVQVPELSAAPVEQQPAPSQNPGPVQSPTPQPTAPATQTPAEPSADTPSGPILAPNSSNASNTAQPSLAPPPDPAPSGQ